MHSERKCVSHSVVSDSLWPHGLEPTRLLSPWTCPGKNIGVGCHFLLHEFISSSFSSFPLTHMSYLNAGSTWSCSFVVSFEIRKCDFVPTVFFFKIVWFFLVAWIFKWILGSGGLFLQRSQIEFWLALCWICRSTWRVVPF